IGSRVLLFLLLAYIGLAAASTTWAADELLAAKRAIVFLVLVFTAYVLAQAWSLREVLFFTIFASAASLMFGIVGAAARGDLHPFAPDYRFVGFANPNLHGIEAACLVIAAAVGLGVARSRRLPLTALLVFGVGMLLLTKSRTALVALMMAGVISVPIVVRRNRIGAMLLLAAAAIFAIVVFAPDTVTHAQHAV